MLRLCRCTGMLTLQGPGLAQRGKGTQPLGLKSRCPEERLLLRGPPCQPRSRALGGDAAIPSFSSRACMRWGGCGHLRPWCQSLLSITTLWPGRGPRWPRGKEPGPWLQGCWLAYVPEAPGLQQLHPSRT